MSTPSNLKHTLVVPLVALALLIAACGSDDTTSAEPSTTGVDTTNSAASESDDSTAPSEIGETPGSEYLGSYALDDEEFGTMVTVTVEGSTRTIVSNALPDHETGEFPNDGNPNEIAAQDFSYSFPLEAVYTGEASFAMVPGVAVNGVSFEPGTGESVTCDSGEMYRIEALQEVHNLGLDFNNAHVQPGGKYHYHGVSQMLVEAYESEEDLVHVGFAADGFLIYYSKSGAYTPSYELATDARIGTSCLATGPDGVEFDVDGSIPDGTYVSDWVFTDGTGQLDSCNGVTIDGQYVYLVTDQYPYIGRCLNGESASAAPGGGEPPTGGAPTPPDLAEVAATLGVSQQDLEDALGNPPYDLDAAAETLGLPVAELQDALPGPADGAAQPADG